MAITTGSSTATNKPSTETTKTNKTTELGKDDFLKLLVTQLANQDPLSPMEDTEFISQMAQFTTLEQMKNLNTTMSTAQAASMIGMKISWAENGEEVFGVVSSVKVVSGQPSLLVGETSVELSKVMSVTVPSSVVPPVN